VLFIIIFGTLSFPTAADLCSVLYQLTCINLTNAALSYIRCFYYHQPFRYSTELVRKQEMVSGAKYKYTNTSIRNVMLPHRLRKLTCHMGSQSDTYHPADVTFPPLPQPKLVLDLARDAWLSWPRHCSKGVCKNPPLLAEFCFDGGRLSVCPSVSLVQNNSKKVIDRLSRNLEGYVENETKKRWLNLEMIRNLFGES